MPDLEQSLQGQDLGHLKIIAQLWGVEFSAPDARVGLQQLVPLISDADLLLEVLSELPAEARQALDELLENEGRLPWTLFTRRYGSLREMGIARRDRDRPYIDSQARTSESLWYRGLIGRSFYDTPNGPEEFAYVPDDFLFVLPHKTGESSKRAHPGRPATQVEKSHQAPATDQILDDACTFLAGLRIGLDPQAIQAHLISNRTSPYPVSVQSLEKLLRAAGLLDRAGHLALEPAREFLEKNRGETLLHLFRSWMHSQQFNELLLLPGLKAEGAWRNDPLKARQAILDFLSAVPGNLPGAEHPPVFWNLNSFVQSIREARPDFQRPSGDYDSWYMMDIESGGYVRGFENWERIDGELIRFLLSGPLHWLGVLDLGFQAEAQEGRPQPASAFRFSGISTDLLSLKPPAGLAQEDETLQLSSDGRISAPRLLARPARYQLARFAEWGGFSRECYEYRLTPASLERARKQGLTSQHLISLMNRHARLMPPSLIKALENWEKHGSEARLERVMVLKVRNPEILQAVRGSKAGRFLGAPLGPTTVEVRAEAWNKLVLAMAELGYLMDSIDTAERINSDTP